MFTYRDGLSSCRPGNSKSEGLFFLAIDCPLGNEGWLLYTVCQSKDLWAIAASHFSPFLCLLSCSAKACVCEGTGLLASS